MNDDKLPKSQIERITRRFVGGLEAERYTVWFFGNPSQTMLKVVLAGREGKKTVCKTLTLEAGQWYKTYDFILDTVAKVNAVPAQRDMFAVSEPSVLWKAIWQAFDISIVNKNFYRDIKAAFDSLIAALSNCKGILTRPEQRAQFAVRLLEESLIAYLSGDTNVQPIFMTSPSKSLSSPSNQVSSPNDSIGDPALKSGFPITPSGMTGNGGDADKGACHAPLQKTISDFVHTAEITANLKPHAATLLEKLNRLKTIDITAGSGAFPIGMLQKVVMLKQALNPKASPYDLKLETIENSIYGVDIQPMAIELLASVAGCR